MNSFLLQLQDTMEWLFHLNIHLFTAEDTSKSIQNVLCILLQKILFLCRQKFQITTRENIPIVQDVETKNKLPQHRASLSALQALHSASPM